MDKTYLNLMGYTVEDGKGAYDIRHILQRNIMDHVREIAQDENEYKGFLDTGMFQTTLTGLLFEDLQELAKNNNELRNAVKKLSIFETSGGIPQAEVLIDELSGGEACILWDKNFLTMVNEAIAINQIMILSDRTEDVLKKDRGRVLSEEYSDSALYFKYAKTVHYFYSKNPDCPRKFEYLYNPLDICEVIKGVRLFVLLHEIAHVIYFDNEYVKDMNDEIKGYEEYMCDKFAIESIMNYYAKYKRIEELYEFRNVMKGIQMYLVLMAKVENYHGMCQSENSNHPYAYLRLLEAFSEIITNSRFDNDAELQYALVQDHFRIKKFHLFCWEPCIGFGGISWQMELSRNPITRRLYENHRSNFENVFKEIVNDSAANGIYKNYTRLIENILDRFDMLRVGETRSFRVDLGKDEMYGLGGLYQYEH